MLTGSWKTLLVACLLLATAVPLWAQHASEPPLVPIHRVYSTIQKQFLDMDAFIKALAVQDVVTLGEVHDDLSSHRLELAVLENLFAARPHLALSLEMFERDVQPALDRYLRDDLAETAFLAQSRPWPNYPSDYRPLVEFARRQRLPVIAANVPQRIARDVAHGGIDALKSEAASDRAFYARSTSAPEDEYWRRFQEAMGGSAHGGSDHGIGGAEGLRHFYESQCLKDDTMAESIADFLQRSLPDHPLVLQVNGAFHTDFGLGTASRIRSRLPRSNVATVAIIPVDDLDDFHVSDYAGQADYLLFCHRHPEK